MLPERPKICYSVSGYTLQFLGITWLTCWYNTYTVLSKAASVYPLGWETNWKSKQNWDLGRNGDAAFSQVFHRQGRCIHKLTQRAQFSLQRALYGKWCIQRPQRTGRNGDLSSGSHAGTSNLSLTLRQKLRVGINAGWRVLIITNLSHINSLVVLYLPYFRVQNNKWFSARVETSSKLFTKSQRGSYLNCFCYFEERVLCKIICYHPGDYKNVWFWLGNLLLST